MQEIHTLLWMIIWLCSSNGKSFIWKSGAGVLNLRDFCSYWHNFLVGKFIQYWFASLLTKFLVNSCDQTIAMTWKAKGTAPFFHAYYMLFQSAGNWKESNGRTRYISNRQATDNRSQILTFLYLILPTNTLMGNLMHINWQSADFKMMCDDHYSTLKVPLNPFRISLDGFDGTFGGHCTRFMICYMQSSVLTWKP